MRAILGHLALVARVTLRDEFVDRIWSDALDRFGPDGALTEVLSRWTEADPRPLVVFIDEIDTLVGDTLLSVLRQLRAGYTLRPDAFPQSVILCGVRDVRDALGDDACFRNKAGRDHRQSITADAVTEARERLIVRRETHLDQLADKLQEDRVRRVIEPLLSGGDEREFSARDLEYVRDLGLIARDDPPRIANPVYAEVVPRELTCAAQAGLVEETAWYIDADGGLNMVKLLTSFQAFFREHSEHWVERFAYKEAGPQLLLQAYLQRVVNGGGRIEREYGLGRGRTDLLIVWPQGSRTRKFVVECKVRRKSLERTIHDGVAQTAGYLDRCGAESGHLVIFDRGDGAWANKIFHRQGVGGRGPDRRVGHVAVGTTRTRCVYCLRWTVASFSITSAGRTSPPGIGRLHRRTRAGSLASSGNREPAASSASARHSSRTDASRCARISISPSKVSRRNVSSEHPRRPRT